MPAPEVPNRADPAFNSKADTFFKWITSTLWDALTMFFDSRLLSTSTVSTTSITIDTATPKTFTVEAGKGYQPGMFIVAANTTSPGNYIAGQVISYNSGTGALSMSNTSRGGSGTLAAWTITQSIAGGGAGLGANTFTGLQKWAYGANIASAATVNLSTATGNTARITGTTATSAFTIDSGTWMQLIAVAAWPLTYNATTCRIAGGQSYTCAAGDQVFVMKDNTGVVYVDIVKADGTALYQKNKLESITVTQAAGAITITVNPCVADFRNSTLTTGTPVTRQITSAKTTTISNGSTGGVTSGQSGRIAVLIVDNGTDFDVAWVNIAGGVQLDETNLISTIAEGGAGAADSGSVIYSTSALSSRPYRVWGFFDAVNTGGAWSNPTKVQPAGGIASTLAAMGVEGDAPIFPARAWVNFNGTGTLAIRGSRNVLSVTDNGAGDYTVNFSSQMPDTNYAVAMSAGLSTTGAVNTPTLPTFSGSGTTPKTTSAVRVWCKQAGALVDADFVDVTVFR